MTLRGGFTIGDWTVHPLEGRMASSEAESRIQPKSMDVLLRLAEAGGTVVGREELLAAVWGERAVSDEPLTRCIGEIRRAFGDSRTEPDYIQTIPKRGYRLLRPVVPLEPAIEDPHSARPPALTEAQSRQRLGTIKKIAAGAAVLVVAAIVQVVVERAIDKYGSDESGADQVFSATVDPDRSIAVMPFVNLNADGEQEYFSDGISEELLNLLAQVTDLRVISRSSAFSYKGKSVDIRTIAEELRVSHVLEGSVRMSGTQVRITADLIDARSDTRTWSETYDRTLDDIFATQDEIAATVVDQLKIRLTGDRPTVQATDPQAYSLFLQARYHDGLFTLEDQRRATELYREALAIDPEYPRAWVALAGNYVNQAMDGLLPFEEGFRLAREAVNRCLELDPLNAAAFSYLGWIAMWHENDLAAAAEYYSRSISLDPRDPPTIGNSALLLKGLGRLDEALELLEYHVVLDPVSATSHYNLALGYLAASRWEQSIQAQETALRLSPGYVGSRSFIGTAQIMLGEHESALATMQEEPLETYRLLGLTMAYHALGDKEASDAALDEMIGKYEKDWAYNIAYVLAYRNDVDLAFEWLDKAIEYGDPGLADIVAEVLFSNLHEDPRWAALLKRLNKSPGQLNAIAFDVSGAR